MATEGGGGRGSNNSFVEEEFDDHHDRDEEDAEDETTNNNITTTTTTLLPSSYIATTATSAYTTSTKTIIGGRKKSSKNYSSAENEAILDYIKMFEPAEKPDDAKWNLVAEKVASKLSFDCPRAGSTICDHWKKLKAIVQAAISFASSTIRDKEEEEGFVFPKNRFDIIASMKTNYLSNLEHVDSSNKCLLETEINSHILEATAYGERLFQFICCDKKD